MHVLGLILCGLCSVGLGMGREMDHFAIALALVLELVWCATYNQKAVCYGILQALEGTSFGVKKTGGYVWRH